MYPRSKLVKSTIDLMYKTFRTNQFERVLEKINVTKLGNGRCLAEFTVEDEHTNILGTLHGGMSATLVDSISSYALASDDRGEIPHVSVDMHLSYLKSAKIGDRLEIDANTIKIGRTLSFLEVHIRDKATGDLLVKGSHTKFMLR